MSSSTRFAIPACIVRTWMVLRGTRYIYHRALDCIATVLALDPAVIVVSEKRSSVHQSKKNVGMNVPSLIRDLLLLLKVNKLSKYA
ncbi:unnamed protein product [Eruca vesicaria subsp. sativa]|uniref:Uncharacterized protein n=1 Tax=Eruca vesicaria subsp. sativa TaxID=29727 RepID=A0ABC8J1L9_ERUVS|nr:unnamed protein product [Eruca vesicaria subsp. sativa]